MSTLDDLLSPMANGPDLADGLCVWQWDLFDQIESPATELAIQLCHQCSVFQRCTEWAATLNDRQLSGVVAGEVRIHASDKHRNRKVSA